MCQLLLGSLLFGQAPYDLEVSAPYWSYSINLSWSIDSLAEPIAINIYRDGEYLDTQLPNVNTGILINDYHDYNMYCSDIDVEHCYTVTAMYGEDESEHSNSDCGIMDISGPPLCMSAGEAHIILGNSSPLEISLDNLGLEIHGFQFNLVIDPLIVSLDTIIATDRLDDSFMIHGNQYDDGNIVVLGFSFSGLAIPEGNGPILEVYLSGDSLGFAEVCIEDGILSNSGGSGPLPHLTDCGSINVIEEDEDCTQCDLNGDGMSNILDIITLVNIILSDTTPTDEQLCIADLNNDGSLNILDIMQYISPCASNCAFCE